MFCHELGGEVGLTSRGSDGVTNALNVLPLSENFISFPLTFILDSKVHCLVNES